MTTNEVFFGLITAAIIALVIVLIWLALRVAETIKVTRKFLDTADQALQQTLVEVNDNLRNLKSITENVNTMTNDIKSFSGCVKDAGGEVKQLTGNIRRIGDTIQGLGIEAVASVVGLRAGLRTGMEVFLKNLFRQVGVK
jgi:uncharacterized protein YoxC